MRTKPCLALLAALALPACGGGDSDDDGDDAVIDAPVGPTADSPVGTIDGPPVVIDADPLAPDADPRFACLGQPIPTTAPTTLTVAGDMQVLGISGGTPVNGATVEAFLVGGSAPIGSSTTAGQGAYEITITNNGGTPIDAFLRAPSMNNKTVYLFPPTLVYEDLPNAPIRTVSNGLFGTLVALAGGTQAAGNGVVALVVTDCLGAPLAGATASSPQTDQAVKYNGANGLPSSTATATAADGIAYIFNVPPGQVTVDAAYMGMDFREHSFLARAADGTDNALNTTTVRP
jgi:hypothetical protein